MLRGLDMFKFDQQLFLKHPRVHPNCDFFLYHNFKIKLPSGSVSKRGGHMSVCDISIICDKIPAIKP